MNNLLVFCSKMGRSYPFPYTEKTSLKSLNSLHGEKAASDRDIQEQTLSESPKNPKNNIPKFDFPECARPPVDDAERQAWLAEAVFSIANKDRLLLLMPGGMVRLLDDLNRPAVAAYVAEHQRELARALRWQAARVGEAPWTLGLRGLTYAEAWGVVDGLKELEKLTAS